MVLEQNGGRTDTHRMLLSQDLESHEEGLPVWACNSTPRAFMSNFLESGTEPSSHSFPWAVESFILSPLRSRRFG